MARQKRQNTAREAESGAVVDALALLKGIRSCHPSQATLSGFEVSLGDTSIAEGLTDPSVSNPDDKLTFMIHIEDLHQQENGRIGGYVRAVELDDAPEYVPFEDTKPIAQEIMHRFNHDYDFFEELVGAVSLA